MGVDIGGTTVKIGLLSHEGNIIEKFEIKTNVENNGESILSDIRDAIYKFLESKSIERSEVTGIGFGVPGPVVNNVIYKCTNLGWGIVDIVEAFGSLLDWNPVIAATNDANAAALGEMHYCGDSNLNSSVLMT
jgi:glucokinase